MTEAEFDRRVRGMEGRMYRTARAMLKNEFDCADAMQNAVFAAWRKLPSLRDEARFEAWLMHILSASKREEKKARWQTRIPPRKTGATWMCRQRWKPCRKSKGCAWRCIT